MNTMEWCLVFPLFPRNFAHISWVEMWLLNSFRLLLGPITCMISQSTIWIIPTAFVHCSNLYYVYIKRIWFLMRNLQKSSTQFKIQIQVHLSKCLLDQFWYSNIIWKLCLHLIIDVEASALFSIECSCKWDSTQQTLYRQLNFYGNF